MWPLAGIYTHKLTRNPHPHPDTCLLRFVALSPIHASLSL